MERSRQLSEESVGKLLLKFSIPAITGMLVNALYNIVDRIFVGNGVHALAISGITIAFPIMNIIMAFGMLVGIGTSSLISIRLGQKNKEEAEQILGNAFILTIIISLIITVFGLLFLDKILLMFGARDLVFEYSRDYTKIILIGVIFQNLAFSLNHSIRASGSPKIAMLSMLIGAIMNTILDPLFIYVFHLGVKGAAIATIMSQAVSAAWVLSFYLRNKGMISLHKRNFTLKPKLILSIFSIGVAPFAMQIAASAITFILNSSLIKYGGDIAVAAMGVINSIAMLILMPIFGINQGVQPIIGFNYGAKNFNRVKQALWLAMIGAVSIATLGFILVEIFPSAIVSVFGRNNQELIEVGAHGLRVYLAMLPFIGFQVISANYFQAVGKPKHSMFLSLTRQVIVLIPLLFILPGIFKLNGVWSAGPTADFIAFLITAVFILREMRNLDKLHGEETATV